MSAPVGADIEALCSKCGDVWHVIVAKVGPEIVRVICKECNAQHRYRHPNKVVEAVTGKPRTAVRAPRQPKVVERFETPHVPADLSKPVRTYKANERFAIGERVEHPTFGQGVVEISEAAKMTVFFAVGRKVLVQAKIDAPPMLSRPKPFEHKIAGPPPDAKAAVAPEPDLE